MDFDKVEDGSKNEKISGSIRAYLLINLKEDILPKKFDEIMRKIDSLNEADFVDAVDGFCDIIAMIEVPVTVKTIVEAIQSIDGVATVQPCRILGIHKEW